MNGRHARWPGVSPWSRNEQASYSQAFYSSDGELLRLSLADDQQYRVWTQLGQIQPQLGEAVQLYEDRWFAWHPGFNPASLLRGAWSSWRGESRRGGSTLSMQLARRLYRIDSRSPLGKLRQIAAALWQELRYGKREILEAYLNLAPYGGNPEGVSAASLVYFGKSAEQVVLPEALALAVIPQNPNRRGGSGAWPPALSEARARLWLAWLRHHPQDRSPARQAGLDLPLRLRNAAALLLDSRTMAVRAWVGSANWFDESIEGQVNASTAKRSPGSTLKPFIYALALDQGLLHPASILKDAPTAFGGYSPENFDGRFEGPITATQALVRSRNIPAVQVSSRLQQPNLYQFPKLAGVSQMASEQHYGLALTLGGGELSMEELATLYAMLANGGELRPLRFMADAAPPQAGQALLSPQAAFITLDMLRQNPRPDTGQPAFPRVAWKTGTSWGFRDAWTAGVFGHYVLVVWLGNFDASANPALVGVQAAAPLFFRIVDSLRSQGLDGGDGAGRGPAHLVSHAGSELCAALASG